MPSPIIALRRCPDCQRPYLQFCVPCYVLAMSVTRRARMKELGLDDTYVLEKLQAAADKGSLTALFKIMKLLQFDLMEQPPKDVDESVARTSLVQMLEELDANEGAVEVESKPQPKLPAPPEK